MTYSDNGNTKLYFDIVDATGTWIHCCALGDRHIKSVALQQGMEVVIYYGAGRSALQSSPAALFVMKEGAIIPIQASAEVPRKSFEAAIL